MSRSATGNELIMVLDFTVHALFSKLTRQSRTRDYDPAASSLHNDLSPLLRGAA